MAGHRPRKRFGQNFLHDRGVIDRILSCIAARPGETVVEIGPGRGALTRGLLASGARVEAVEMDRDLAPGLDGLTGPGGPLVVHCADALSFPLAGCGDGTDLRVVGNLPYNISTPLLFHLFDQRSAIRDIHVMLQREVVERMVAPPGSRTFGRLSVMTQYQCQVERLFNVAPGAFHPVPAVDSAVVRLRPRPTAETPPAEARRLAELVACAFGQRRKTLRRTLRGRLDDAALAACGVDPGSRPEALGLDAWRCLARHPGDGAR